MARKGPLVIRLTKPAGDLPTGTEVGVERESDAKRLYPDYEVVSYQDGTPYDVASAPDSSTPDVASAPASEPAPAPAAAPADSGSAV